MYLDLIKKNIKSNVKDYTLYFITITVIISIFFAFDSTDIINYVTSLIGLQSQYRVEGLRSFLLGISVIVMIGLTIIIIYSNSFLVKRRRKEIGVCLSLGMSKSTIAKVMFFEAILIAIVALIIGIIGGVILTQLILLGILHMTDTGLRNYKFIFSLSSFIKTIIYFLAVFIIVGFINMSLVARNLSDSLKSKKKKSLLVQNGMISSVVILAVGAIGLGVVYYIVLHAGFESEFLTAMVLGLISVIIFMVGIVNVIIHIACRKNSYLKGINIFLVCQLKSNAGRIVITSIITGVLLFIAMVSIGLTVDAQGSSVLETMNPKVDAIVNPTIGVVNPSQFDYIMQKSGADKHYNYVPTLQVLFAGNLDIKGSKGSKTYNQFCVASLDWYNQYLKLIGESPVKLKSDEAIIVAKSQDELNVFKTSGENQSFDFEGEKYNVVNDKVLQNYQGNFYMMPNTPLIILPVQMQIADRGSKVIITKGGKELNLTTDKYRGFDPYMVMTAKAPEYNTIQAYNKLSKNLNNLMKNHEVQKVLGIETQGENNQISVFNVFNISSKAGEMAYSKENKIVSEIIGIYISAIFLIGSAALIGLQVLIETNEEREKYKTLKELGVNKDEINKNLRKQVFVRFAIPSVFAVVNIIVFSKVVGFLPLGSLSELTKSPVLIAIIISVIVYILYGIISYTMAEKVIEK